MEENVGCGLVVNMEWDDVAGGLWVMGPCGWVSGRKL